MSGYNNWRINLDQFGCGARRRSSPDEQENITQTAPSSQSNNTDTSHSPIAIIGLGVHIEALVSGEESTVAKLHQE